MMNCCAWAAFAAAIASLPLTSGAQERQAAAITIERIAPGRWSATYTFSDPVTSLRFVRGAANHRERVWAVVTPGYRWVRSDDRGIPFEVLDRSIRAVPRDGDVPAARYCPRCASAYLESVSTCSACEGVLLVSPSDILCEEQCAAKSASVTSSPVTHNGLLPFTIT